MEKQTDSQSSAYEQTVISIMRRLPHECVVQLVSFAYFLEFQTTQSYKKWLEEEGTEAGEEKWDRLFAKPEAMRVMRAMAREARQEYRAGRTTDIEITEDGRLSPA
jgi:hypothetical protein